MCDAVEGRYLAAPDVLALREAAIRAEGEGAGAVFLSDGPLGDAIVLAAGLSTVTSRLLLGVPAGFGTGTHRHPSVLARELTTLDLLSGGRAVLCFSAPFTDEVAEAMTLCRDMWRNGTAFSSGPHYPVPGAVNRPLPASGRSPQLALDLTGGAKSESGPEAAGDPGPLHQLADLVLRPTAEPGVCRIERK